MAQHKYGVRVNSEPGWVDFFQKLGNAAVIIDLLHVKPSRPMIINEDCATSTCGKGSKELTIQNLDFDNEYKYLN